MDHIITQNCEIQEGDVLKLHSNVGVTDERPHGKGLSLKLRADVPTHNTSFRPYPESVMDLPELHQSIEIWVPTGKMGMRVIRKTPRFIMVDLVRVRRDEFAEPHDSVEYANVMIARGVFEWTFLQQAKYSCYKKHTHNPRWLAGDVRENPPVPTADEEDGGDVNPPARMPQANRYMISGPFKSAWLNFLLTAAINENLDKRV